LISIDDFNLENIRLAKLIKSYGLEKDTWFAIDLREREALSQITELNEMGFNLASHTMNHTFLSQVDIPVIEYELNQSKVIIQGLTGKDVDWIVYPRGRVNDEVVEIAKKCGYKYGRTTLLFNKDDMQQGGCHLTYPRNEYEGIDPFEWAKRSHLNHYWGHCSEIIKFHLWDKFEEFLKWYKEQHGI